MLHNFEMEILVDKLITSESTVIDFEHADDHFSISNL